MLCLNDFQLLIGIHSVRLSQGELVLLRFHRRLKSVLLSFLHSFAAKIKSVALQRTTAKKFCVAEGGVHKGGRRITPNPPAIPSKNTHSGRAPGAPQRRQNNPGLSGLGFCLAKKFCVAKEGFIRGDVRSPLKQSSRVLSPRHDELTRTDNFFDFPLLAEFDECIELGRGASNADDDRFWAIIDDLTMVVLDDLQ